MAQPWSAGIHRSPRNTDTRAQSVVSGTAVPSACRPSWSVQITGCPPAPCGPAAFVGRIAPAWPHRRPLADPSTASRMARGSRGGPECLLRGLPGATKGKEGPCLRQRDLALSGLLKPQLREKAHEHETTCRGDRHDRSRHRQDCISGALQGCGRACCRPSTGASQPGSALFRLHRAMPCRQKACAGAHFRARELTRPDHEVRLMPPSYAKPPIKRHTTDAADAKRSTMR